MNLLQAFKMAFKSIAMKKTRSFLTMLGIIIGVASVVIMVSVLQGQNRKNMEYWEKMGDNKINVSCYSYMDSNDTTAQKLYDYCLTLNDLIVGITPNVEVREQVTIRSESKTLKTNDWDSMQDSNGMIDWTKQYSIKLGSEYYGLCNNLTLGGGREVNYLEIEKTLPVCVLGYNVKDILFGYTDPIGESITLNGQPFQVVGWYNPIGMEGYGEWDSVVVIPYSFNRALNKNQQITDYVVKGRDAQSTVEAMTKLKVFINGMFPTDVDGNKPFGDGNVSSNTSYVQEMENQNMMQTLVMGAIAGISLLVGGIGIMNIMLVTVTERTREIGIRKAIGAERASIITQFLIEAAVICSIGGLIGIGIGTVGTLIAGKMLLQESSMLPSTFITVGAFLFSVVLGVIFGMYPAIKASGLQPVVALRAD